MARRSARSDATFNKALRIARREELHKARTQPALLAALNVIAGGMGEDMLGTTSLSREDMQGIASDAIAAAESKGGG